MEKNRSVRCKFYCNSVAQTASQPNAQRPEGAGKVMQEQITLSPVYGDENKPWSQFTPCGSMSLTITNPDALGSFVPGEVYFIDISPADA